jgi:hypothetical protein
VLEVGVILINDDNDKDDNDDVSGKEEDDTLGFNAFNYYR